MTVEEAMVFAPWLLSWYTVTMNEIDLAYAAGLFDGEGCVSINRVKPARNPNLKDGFQLRCSISLTDESLMDWFQDMFGGYVMFRQRARAQDYWQWVVTSNNAFSFLEIIEPYLRLKRGQAQIGIEFTNFRKENAALNKTPEYWDKNFEYYEGVRKLNARWGTEYYTGA